MITLVALNGEAFVWSAHDWLILRKEHRICGNLIGTLGMLPHQDKHLALPLALLPEETRFLLQEKIARLVDYESFREKPSGNLKEKFEDFRRQSYQDQVKYFQDERRRKILEMVDIIVEGKKRKILGSVPKKGKRRKTNFSTSTEAGCSYLEETVLPDRESVIKDELNKVVPIPEEAALTQVPTETPWIKDLTATEIQYPMPQKKIEWLKFKTFADLWRRGFYVTAGQKFGGDFLAYPGDPMKFHAQYIITCRLPEESIPALEFISLCRFE
ncbi:Hypothetical predicted protein [Cloeon dipterum]|uniref:tRNA-splicing endonuclease subunit Sen34 n=1 Tax=Cloeon dipterum TaxID=197152 RepID=A0A8S1CCY7_9INSE|nr:Hypothetical predicted protein [Cloeon dipterum]